MVHQLALYVLPHGPQPALFGLNIHFLRVEGEGAAKITDVIYNTATVTNEVPQDGSSKMEYERMVAEIRERQKEMGYLALKEEVLRNEKSLLTLYASHVCRVQSAKVGGAKYKDCVLDWHSIPTFMQHFAH